MFNNLGSGQAEFENEEQEAQGLDYELAADGKFTADNQEAITLKRELLDNEIQKKAVFMRVMEVSGVSLSCYAIARFLILTGGFNQVWFACAFVFLCQQIQNRDIFSNFNVNYAEGWQMNGGVAVFRFLGSLVSTAFLCYLAMGDVLNAHRITEQTYQVMIEQIQVYNEAPKDEQEKMIGMMLVGVLGTLIILGIYANMSKNNNI